MAPTLTSEASSAYASRTHSPEEGPVSCPPWALPPAPARAGQKRPRSVRCGKCDGCEREDCGTCKNCVDKPKFGGIGQRKQGCIRKLCRAPRVATALPNG